MSLDGIFVSSIEHDLNKLIGGRIDKIYQPDKNEIIIAIRNDRENYKLLMTAASSNPRIHTTKISRKNPEQPPMFCMLLRKHLTGARLVNVKQINFDRIIEVIFECKDELKTDVTKSLIIEMMGKHSNIIFINTETKQIIDSIKRVAENISSVRQVYPGLNYTLPPSDKLNPLTVTKEVFFNTLDKYNNGVYIFDFMYKAFTGFSPFISREICYLSNLNESTYIGEITDDFKEILWNAFSKTIKKIKGNDYIYNIYIDKSSDNFGFYCLELEYLSSYNKKSFDEPGELLDTYYRELDNKNKINQRVSSLLKSITTKIERDKKKVQKRKNELANAENREKYKIYGDLILVNLHKKAENNKLKVVNYYDPEQKEISIPLDPRLNLSQNSQKFFKRYNKLKNAEEELKKLIDSSLNEIKYLENILFSIEECDTVEDLDDIYRELASEGFIKRKGKIKKGKEHKSKFVTYISSGGHTIMVGKNNLQNDLLTFKVGKKDDFWFHAKNMPGSHVIIKTNGDELTDEEYVEAAKVAAYYSKGKNSSHVEIDYTKKSNVKKPPNAKPGFVIYYTNYSMLVAPDITNIKLMN